jgi:hypothetical protein
MAEMHPSVTAHPDWQEFLERRARLEAGRRAALKAAADWDADVKRGQAEHRAALTTAIDAGEAPPPPYQPATERPDSGAALTRIQAAQEALREEEKAWLADHADELLEVLYRREQRLLDEAGPVAGVLAQLVPEWSTVAATASKLRTLRGERPAQVTVTAGAIVDAVSGGRRNGWVPAPKVEATSHDLDPGADVVHLGGGRKRFSMRPNPNV